MMLYKFICIFFVYVSHDLFCHFVQTTFFSHFNLVNCYPPAPPPTVFAPPTILQPQSNESPILATNLYTPSSHRTLQVGEPCIIVPIIAADGDDDPCGLHFASTVNIGLPSIVAC